MFYIFLLALTSQTAHAGIFERQKDTRTSLPEQIAKDRKDWGLDLELGLTRAMGNIDQKSGNSSFAIFKNFDRWTTYLNGEWLYVAFSNANLQNQGAETVRTDYRIDEHWRVFAFNTNAYNQFLLLNYRSTTGIGPWYDIKEGALKEGLSIAPAYDYESYDGYGKKARYRLSF